MPSYLITDNQTGRKFKVTGDSPPTEAEAAQIFADMGGGPSNNPADYPQGKTVQDQDAMRREFIKNEGSLKTRLQNTPAKEMLSNLAYEAPRLAQEVVTVPLSSAKKGLYGLGALAKTGGLLIRGNDLDTALRTGAENMQGFTPVQGPLDSSVTGEVIGRGIENLQGAAENVTGNTGFAKAGIEAAADIVGLVGGGKVLAKSGRSLASLGKSAADKTGLTNLVPTAEKLYASSLKQSTTIPMEQRAANVKTGLEGGYVPSKKGLNTLYDDINSYNRQIGDAIQQSAAGGKTVPVESIITRLDDVKQRAIDSFGDNNNILAKIDDFAQSLRDHPAVKDGQIPIDVAQSMKTNTYKQLKNAYGELKGFEVEAKKAMARGAKEEIVAQIPELAELNAKDSALINLEKVLFKAVNRIENRDLVGIGLPIKIATGAMGGAGGATIGAIAGLIDTPAIKANLALALHKARRKTRQPTTMQKAKLDAAAILQTLATQRGEQTAITQEQ